MFYRIRYLATLSIVSLLMGCESQVPRLSSMEISDPNTSDIYQILSDAEHQLVIDLRKCYVIDSFTVPRYDVMHTTFEYLGIANEHKHDYETAHAVSSSSEKYTSYGNPKPGDWTKFVWDE